ncbi:C2 domain-containing protein 5 isoform X1 [Lucilia cuprina]|uniref:C2 domain-containing protein 5 isoform X1 n=1 Tax=Lucilia cuprina TaxID=7375 RepID=UPI001F05410C|nr:C2 domain-containing protein 5 isoform X1 [Lucilia cuprina]
MPGKVGVKIKAGRNLPVMDKSSDTTDAYVEIKLGNVTHKTDVCRKSLNPQWNTDWFRFEVDDAELQDEPLQIRLMDHDTYSANDAIGKVNIGLNPLCLETSGQTTQGKGTVLSGWIPVFDTMHGIRGEVNVIVKVDLFSDVNKFRQSSCGIPFFHSPCIPIGYRAQVIHGFVEELVVNDDPEYQWIDKIRTPRASNEARQVVFLKLSGQVQRKMGLKAINMGANAVIAYTQCFDLEGDVGVVARGIGTAVTLIKDTTNQPTSADNALIEERTLKYLEFLTGASINPRQKSSSTLSFSKLNFDSSLLDVREADSDPESQLMMDLIRQEEGRGGRRIKKFTHKMKHLTNSSRNILNDKYALLMRKIDEHSRSSSSGSRSLSSVIYFPTKNVNMRSESNSMLDVRKAKKSWTHSEPISTGKKLQKTTHPIVRSVSDDSAMKQPTPSFNTQIHKTTSKDQRVGSESTISTQSSPDVCSTEQCSCNFPHNVDMSSCLEMHNIVANVEVNVANKKTDKNADDILENPDEFSFNSGRRFSSQPDLVNFATNCASSHLHSQSLNNVNIAPMPANLACKQTIKKNFNTRPASIVLASTTEGNSFCVASDRLMAATAMMRMGPAIGKSSNSEGMDMLEYPFLTMTKYPPGLILHIGATVAARSVKLLERVPNPDEPEIRDSWWTELRMEIRSHARSLGCNVVLGYSELTTISDDVCVLSATGTAAIIIMGYNRSISQNDIFNITKTAGGSGMSVSLEERNVINSDPNAKDMGSGISNGSVGKRYGLPAMLNVSKTSCTVCHVPYNVTSVPFNVKMKKCAICLKGRVPDVLLATLEVPESIQVTGRGCFLQAQVVRAKKDLRSELNAKEISDGLPFLEYELHRVLINKLKAKGMNAIFGLKVQVSIGERMIALVATGTALFITALPVPQVPKIVAGNSWTDKQKLNELQKKLQETFERYQEIYQLKSIDQDMLDKSSDTDDSDEEGVDVDLNCGNKDTCVLEVDDIEDLEIISLLMESQPPEGFHVVSTQKVPGMMDIEAVKNLQMFTQVWRAKTDTGQTVTGFPKHFQRLMQIIYFKLRTMIPCAICDLKFKLDFPESDQIQILVTGMALGLGDPNKLKNKRKNVTNGQSDSNDSMSHTHSAGEINNKKLQQLQQEEDYMFPLDEDHMVETPTPATNIPLFGAQLFKNRKSSPIQLSSAPGSMRQRHNRVYERNGVDITPLSFIPGGKIEKYLGNLNFFFIRESTSIRENGGISGFVHGFITELLAVVRAHISALGGNAMVSFYLTELILFDNQHKNQGQCLISIGGDAVYVSYHQDD